MCWTWRSAISSNCPRCGLVAASWRISSRQFRIGARGLRSSCASMARNSSLRRSAAARSSARRLSSSSISRRSVTSETMQRAPLTTPCGFLTGSTATWSQRPASVQLEDLAVLASRASAGRPSVRGPRGQSIKLVERPPDEFAPGPAEDPLDRLVDLHHHAVAVEQDDAVVDGVEGGLPLPARDLRRFFGLAGPQQRPDGGDQLERLQDVGQVAVGAPFQPLDLVLDVDEGRGEVKHGDVGRGGVGLDPPADLESAHVRQLDVEDDQVGQSATSRRASVPVVASRIANPAFCEDLGDRVPLGLVVVDDQDGDGLRISHVTPPTRIEAGLSPALSRASLIVSSASCPVEGDLSRIAAVPAPIRRRSSSSRFSEVLMITGISRVASSAFSRSSTCKPGHVGHDQVEEDDVGAVRARPPEAFLAAAGFDDAIRPAGGEELLEPAAIALLVVDDQDRLDGSPRSPARQADPGASPASIGLRQKSSAPRASARSWPSTTVRTRIGMSPGRLVRLHLGEQTSSHSRPRGGCRAGRRPAGPASARAAPRRASGRGGPGSPTLRGSSRRGAGRRGRPRRRARGAGPGRAASARSGRSRDSPRTRGSTRGITAKNVEPTPGSLRTETLPPSSSASFRDSGSPSPVPLICPCSGPSIWPNSSKIRS